MWTKNNPWTSLMLPLTTKILVTFHPFVVHHQWTRTVLFWQTVEHDCNWNTWKHQWHPNSITSWIPCDPNTIMTKYYLIIGYCNVFELYLITPTAGIISLYNVTKQKLILFFSVELFDIPVLRLFTLLCFNFWFVFV